VTRSVASTAGTADDVSTLSHLACVTDVDGSAYCYGISFEGWSLAYWSPDPAQGEWMRAIDRPIANEDRPRPSDDVTAADYLDAWYRPSLDSVTLFARDRDAPSTQVVGNYGIAWDPGWADSADGWERVQGFAEATGCDLPTEPPTFAREWYC
jgi:hypothetical protein